MEKMKQTAISVSHLKHNFGTNLDAMYIPAKQHNSPEGTACHSASNCTMQLMCKFMLCAYPYRCIPSGTP